MVTAMGAAYLVHADVAFVAEDHLVAIFTLGRAAHVTDDILIILDAQPLLRLDGPRHVLVAQSLQLLQHALERQLIQLWPLCEDSRAGCQEPGLSGQMYRRVSTHSLVALSQDPSSMVQKLTGLDHATSKAPGGWCGVVTSDPACDHTHACVHTDTMEVSLGCSRLRGQPTA